MFSLRLDQLLVMISLIIERYKLRKTQIGMSYCTDIRIGGYIITKFLCGFKHTSQTWAIIKGNFNSVSKYHLIWRLAL